MTRLLPPAEMPGSARASSSSGVAGLFTHDAERERLVKILMRWVPAEYRWIVLELAKREPKAPAEIVSVVHERAA